MIIKVACTIKCSKCILPYDTCFHVKRNIELMLKPMFLIFRLQFADIHESLIMGFVMAVVSKYLGVRFSPIIPK